MIGLAETPVGLAVAPRAATPTAQGASSQAASSQAAWSQAASSQAASSQAASSRGDAQAAPTILCVGLSHHTAPVALRERLALGEHDVAAILARFGCGDGARPSAVSELVILSTCNRLELYASGGRDADASLIALLEEATGAPPDAFESVLYRLHGGDVVRHLCRTAAGLDSMVIGESQILGQISNAFAAAVAQRAAGHALSALFRGAIRAGRRARAETGINHNPASVSSLAVKLASDSVADLASARIVVVGAGEMAQLALKAFAAREATRLCVVSRTTEHAASLAAAHGAAMAPLERLQAEIADADVLISATAAPHAIVTRAVVANAMALRPARPLAILDIAVPRDVEPAVREIPGVRCWDLDDLEAAVRDTVAEREQEIPRVEEIVTEEAERCLAELQQLDVQPLIADLRARADSIRRDALARALRELDGLDEAERRVLDTFSQSLVNKLLHQPMVRLRDEARLGQAAGYAMAVRHLFGLEA